MTAMLSQSPGLQREHAHQAVRLYHRESADAVPLQSAGFLEPPEDAFNRRAASWYLPLTEDNKEAKRAFAEKRPPVFKGR